MKIWIDFTTINFRDIVGVVRVGSKVGRHSPGPALWLWWWWWFYFILFYLFEIACIPTFVCGPIRRVLAHLGCLGELCEDMLGVAPLCFSWIQLFNVAFILPRMCLWTIDERRIASLECAANFGDCLGCDLRFHADSSTSALLSWLTKHRPSKYL